MKNGNGGAPAAAAAAARERDSLRELNNKLLARLQEAEARASAAEAAATELVLERERREVADARARAAERDAAQFKAAAASAEEAVVEAHRKAEEKVAAAEAEASAAKEEAAKLVESASSAIHNPQDVSSPLTLSPASDAGNHDDHPHAPIIARSAAKEEKMHHVVATIKWQEPWTARVASWLRAIVRAIGTAISAFWKKIVPDMRTEAQPLLG